MAAYAAVISLKHTIQHYLLHPNSHLPVVSSSRDIIQFVDDELTSVQSDLKRLDGRKRSSRRLMEALDGQIRDAVYKLEDVIESHVSDQIHSQSEEKELLISFEEARQEISSLIQEVKKTKEQYSTELETQDVEEDEDAVSSGVDFDHGKKNFLTLSLSNFKRNIGHHLSARMPCGLGVVSIVGEEGTGRTMLANAAFNHKDATCCDRRAWVSVGPKYEVKEIIISLLSQIDPDHDEGELWDDEKLDEQLYTSLKGRKYLISLHNVCDTDVWDNLRSSFPDEKNGSRVLITTSLEEVARFANSFRICPLEFLNEEQCWSVISLVVFFFMPCPAELEEAGKKIVQNCQGLPLEILKVSFLLQKGEKTPEYWNEIAEHQLQNCVSKDAYDEISELCDEMPEISQSKEGLQWENFPFEAVKLGDIHGNIVRNLFLDNWCKEPQIISIYGMAGIGKTTLAKEVFEDPSTLRHFDHRVWVTLGPKYRYERILVDILAQIDPNMSVGADEILAKNIRTILSSKTCLIVMDDVWDKEPLCNLLELFKDIKFEVLLTTRLEEVAQMGSICHMRLLDNEESWRLFCEKVFGEKSCPAELEKPGRLIVENCEGLPLMIVTIASLLFQAEKTPKFWNKVARKENSVFKDAYDKIYNTLLPSYEYLPQHLKPFFLYMGVFPVKFEICNSKLLSLWNSEGILELDFSEYLEKLHSSSLLIVHYNSKIKTCRLHSVFWHLCVKKARNIKFFHVLNKIIDGSAEDIDGQRRLCIHNNILFGIKDVHTSMTSNSTVRSLLCTGSNHQYQVPVCFSFMLLRIFDALTIRFYEFPVEAFELVLLRYLALTCNGMLPASISKLCSLQYLIVGRHLSIKLLYEAPVYLPMEIWDMKQLKHLQVLGGDLPDPCGAVLPNLLILLDVSPHSCTESVFLGTPSLQKLGVRIELAPNASESLFKFDHIPHLHKLESLKCVVVNPEFRSEVAPPLSSGSFFRSGLKKLSLSGLGYPWEYMSVIGELENLEMLKLRCYAFRGPEWTIHDGEFNKLEYLLIEDTDLVNWSADSNYSISGLRHLIIRHCYKLREIHYWIRGKQLLENIEFVDCHPSASCLQFPNFRSSSGPYAEVHSSWE